MARLKSPLFSLRASKQLGKSLIYKTRGSRSFVTGYNKPGGKNPSPTSPTQLNQRMIYNLIIARWQTFTDDQRAVWNNDSRTDTLRISGWNLFLREALLDLPTQLGLQGYWSFNRIVNGEILDLSGNGNDGTLEPSYPSNAPQLIDSYGPKFGKCASFDGIDDQIDCGNHSSLNLSETISVECWVKISTFDQSDSYPSIVKKTGGSPVNGYAIFFSNGTDKISTSIKKDDGSIHLDIFSPTLGKWHHVVMTYDNQWLRGFHDSIPCSPTSTADKLGYTSEPLQIGGIPGGFLYCEIDEVRIWNRILSPTETQKHYALISKK